MTRDQAPQPKVTLVERVAEMAMCLGQRYLADYGAARSRHDFTQRQLMSCLILRAYWKTTYRRLLEQLEISPTLRMRLGFEDKLPHFTTLQKFSQRSKVVEIAQIMLAEIAKAVPAQPLAQSAAMDSTGLTTHTASNYFRSRTGNKCNQWVKLSVIVLCGSLLPVAMAVSLGPSNDRTQAKELLGQAQALEQRPAKLYADGGYDAEWIHAQCREQWGVESIIKPLNQRADGSRGGRWRSKMSPTHLRRRGYGKRWAVESYFSALKRTVGSALSARRADQMIAEACFRVLAYALRR